MSDSNPYTTDQEAFWAGEFGSEYINRNRGDVLVASNVSLFAHALRATGGVGSCIEFGANIGLNLRALKLLYPNQDQFAIEINPDAARQLEDFLPQTNVFNGSILDFHPARTWSLALIKGVLIHLNPDVLPQVYDKLVAASERYILVAEYYNPVPVAIPYRGHEGRLFKRDFAGEIMDRHPQCKLVDYGFVYRRDPQHPQDDTTWFLLEKRG